MSRRRPPCTSARDSLPTSRAGSPRPFRWCSRKPDAREGSSLPPARALRPRAHGPGADGRAAASCRDAGRPVRAPGIHSRRRAPAHRGRFAGARESLMRARDLRFRLRALFARERMDQELTAELQHHVATQAALYERQGFTPDVARRLTEAVSLVLEKA